MPLIEIDAADELSLQQQIRRRLIEAIVAGTITPGQRLPSSRALSVQLGVARNTVFLAYQQLVADGHVESRPRSGLFVAQACATRRVGRARSDERRAAGAGDCDWSVRMRRAVRDDEVFRPPPNWRDYPFPFVDGLLDGTLFPLAEWREASRMALGARQIQGWATEGGDSDDAMLVEEIRTKLLPRRGIHARADEILLTIGVQQALDLTTRLLVDRGVTVALGNPGDPALRQSLRHLGANLIPLAIDEEGIAPLPARSHCDLVCVTPTAQVPTGATMPIGRRRALLRQAVERDFVILEDGSGDDLSTDDRPLPSLRSLDRHARVVYVTTLSRVLEPGLRLGVIVAPPPLIRELRTLRRLAVHHPPRNNQRAAAFFIALGHLDASNTRIAREYRRRLLALRDALNHYLHQWVRISQARGGTSFWIHGPRDLDVRSLIRSSERRGVLIEPVQHFFAAGDGPANVFRLGITSLPMERIRPGVAALREAVRDCARAGLERLDADGGSPLQGARLREALAGVTLLYKTVYGDPCTIELCADGSLIGRAGWANEDCDSGRWWVEGDRWWRQWDHWAYGEPTGFYTSVDGDRVKWYDAQRMLVDSAVIGRTAPSGPVRDRVL
jgi:GntR family transcriptional regulator/MocR family aminotransferase